MSQKKTHTKWIRLVATPKDKALLDAITARRENDGFSETVRQLIREEAARRGIRYNSATSQVHSEQAA